MPEPAAGPDFERARTHFLEGLACFEAGRLEDAERCFEASLALLPGRVSTLVNLAATRLALARPHDALDAADRVLAAEPASFDGWLHRAEALAQLGRHDEALAACGRVLALDDRLAEPWLRHGQALHALGRRDEALASYDRALAIDPALAQAWVNRGTALREAQRLAEAARAFERAAACGADPALVGYYLAAVGGTPDAPPAAPAHYVQALFDDYAGQFDAHVAGGLRYRAPELLAAPLAAPGRGGRASALDLGCGTGLCAPLLRPLARRLTGVDLSAGMLERAATLGLYDRLVQADIVEHLRDAEERHDLVVAADVFIYLGDLAPAFAAAHAAMRPGGTFCFSAERAPDDGPGFVLLPSLRYAHSERHLRALAEGHGFDVARLAHATVREEQRRAVAGMYVWLTRR